MKVIIDVDIEGEELGFLKAYNVKLLTIGSILVLKLNNEDLRLKIHMTEEFVECGIVVVSCTEHERPDGVTADQLPAYTADKSWTCFSFYENDPSHPYIYDIKALKALIRKTK
jgi:hypothetical protein